MHEFILLAAFAATHFRFHQNVNCTNEVTKHRLILVVSVPVAEYKHAQTALERAGIMGSFSGGRGVIGFLVKQADVIHAKEVLQHDALMHHSKITLID